MTINKLVRGKNFKFVVSVHVAEVYDKHHVDPGEVLRVTTPPHEFVNASLVTFKTYLYTEEYDVLPRLRVYIDTPTGVQREPVLEISKTWR